VGPSIINVHDWEVCHREIRITVSSRCPDTFDQIVYIQIYLPTQFSLTVHTCNFHRIICSEVYVASPRDHTFVQQEFSLWAVISSELAKEIFINMLNFHKSCKQL
jgi:hypothetical protein